MQIRKDLIVNAPISKVWKAFSRLEKWPQFCSYIEIARWTSEEEWKQNSAFTQTINIFGMERVSHAKVIGIKKPEFVTWTGTGHLIRGIHTLKFEKISSKKTKAVNKEYFKGILAPIIFPLIKSEFENYFVQFLNGLKREVEK